MCVCAVDLVTCYGLLFGATCVDLVTDIPQKTGCELTNLTSVSPMWCLRLTWSDTWEGEQFVSVFTGMYTIAVVAFRWNFRLRFLVLRIIYGIVLIPATGYCLANRNASLSWGSCLFFSFCPFFFFKLYRFSCSVLPHAERSPRFTSCTYPTPLSLFCFFFFFF